MGVLVPHALQGGPLDVYIRQGRGSVIATVSNQMLVGPVTPRMCHTTLHISAVFLGRAGEQGGNSYCPPLGLACAQWGEHDMTPHATCSAKNTFCVQLDAAFKILRYWPKVAPIRPQRSSPTKSGGFDRCFCAGRKARPEKPPCPFLSVDTGVQPARRWTSAHVLQTLVSQTLLILPPLYFGHPTAPDKDEDIPSNSASP